MHLRRIADAADDEAQKQKERQVVANAKSWAQHVEMQVKIGARSAHRLIKRDEQPIHDFTTAGEGAVRSASLAQIVAADLPQRKAIWTRLVDSPTAPWRQAQCDDTLPPITGSEVAAAAR